MQLTEEQKQILATSGNLSIAAVAGSGKTSTVIEYARSRPAGSRILYLAFNKSVKLEAIQKFDRAGLRNVQVETAHSLAYAHVMRGQSYALRDPAYKPHDIVELLHISAGGADAANFGPHYAYIIARHILGLASMFCNSAADKVSELDYLSIVGSKARGAVEYFYPQIERGARELLAMMKRGQCGIFHDFYLKEFQLSRPQLPFDYILFDEGQDASPAMTAVFGAQDKAVKVIVGDPHQQIYGWRGAFNAMDSSGFPSALLSQSFRFGADIARLASEVLDWKKAFQPNHTSVHLSGTETKEEEVTPSLPKQKAILARTNLGLLLRAIDAMEAAEGKRLYFEGNINSYTYAEDGASLYDVLNLHLAQHTRIRDPFLRKMRDLAELEDYVDQTEDRSLGMLVEIVKKWGRRIPEIIQSLKAAHVGDAERQTADIIFSTVHRAKGMEYDTVELAADFISEKTVIREGQQLLARGGGKVSAIHAQDAARLSEEINLLYVAVTRAKRQLILPEFLRPKEFPDSASIVWLKMPKEEQQVDVASPPVHSIVKENNGKAYSVSTIREQHKDAYAPWNKALDTELRELAEGGENIASLANHFGRTKGAIRSRLRKLGEEEMGVDSGRRAFEASICEVTLLCGLPGMGKDLYIRQHCPALPVVSLDDIRREHKLKPEDKSATGWVVQQAKDQARVHLRAKRDFLWNATNITRQMRTQLVALFASYGARIKIVYVERPFEKWRAQNANREHQVPNTVLDKLLKKLEVPTPDEAHEVVYWIT